MAIAPPSGPAQGSDDSDNQHAGPRLNGSDDTETSLPVVGTNALDPVELERAIAAAAASSIEEEIEFYESETSPGLTPDPKRNARLWHEVARLRERQGSLREAGKIYTQSLTADPTLQANTWALFRLFSGRGAWENLLRLLDAELRFAPLPTASDRADVLVEKGRLLEDRLGRPADARAAYRSALELDRNHPAALLALLLSALQAGPGDAAVVEEALRGLVQVADDPGVRALLAVELSRLERGSLADGGEPERVKRAADTLFKALLGPAAEEPICEELDRLSLAADDPDLRARVLDLLDSRLGREHAPWRADRPLLVALHREKARLLARRGARDGALAVLERGLRAAPGHPLLVADLLDVAEEANRPDSIAQALSQMEQPPGSYRYDEALLRRGEAGARAGALGEAAGSLDQLTADSPLAPLAALARVRLAARLGDAEGLSRLFEVEAERLAATVAGATAESGEPRTPAAAREAAHLLCRAAVIRLEDLDDPPGAEALLARALELAPGYPPARETLRAALVQLRNWQALADLYQREVELTPDPEAKRPLLQSLLLLRRDVLRDAEAASRLEAELGPGEDEAFALTRGVDQLGDRFVATGEGAEETIRQLRTLSERAENPALAAALRLLAARVSAEAGAERAALALTEEAFRCHPATLAAGELERQYRAAGRHEEAVRVLEAELDSVREAGEKDEVRVRSLRMRLAQAAVDAGRHEQALAALAPLRAEHDRMAVHWSWEIARSAAKPALEVALLSEPDVIETLAAHADGDPAKVGGTSGTDGDAARLLALAEALEDTGNIAAAADSYRELQDQAGSEPGPRTEAALGLFRTGGAAAEEEPTRVAAFAALAAALADVPGGQALRRQSALLALVTGEGLDDDSAVAHWLGGARAKHPGRLVDGLEGLAADAEAADAAAAVFATAGVRRLLTGQPAAEGSLARGAAGELAPLVEVAFTDLGDGPSSGSLAGLRRARAERLVAEGSQGSALALALLLEDAARAESEGRARDAAAVYARALALEPGSLEATEGLRRVVEGAGRLRAAAAALVRLAGLCRDPRRAAERFAEAALLFEAEGLVDDAAQAFVEVLRREPDDDEAYHRLQALAERWDRPADLERLLSFKLGRTEEAKLRVALYARRAALRAGPLASPQEAIHDHRRILAIDPDRAESLRFLGRQALEQGRAAAAVPFYERALRGSGEVAAGAEVRLELAQAYEAVDRHEDAVRVLRQAIDARPEDPSGRERLISLALRGRDHSLAIEQLQALEALTAEKSAKAALAVRRGRLERDRRNDRTAALPAFRTALELDPLGEAAGELVATVGDGPLAPEDAAAANQVIASLRESLGRDPLDVRRLECLRDLAGLRGLGDLRDVAAQLLNALGVGVARGRARDLTRSVPLASLGAFGIPGSSGPGPGGSGVKVPLMNEIWPHLCEGVARIHALDPGELGANRSTRVAPGADPRLAWAESASVALGIPSLSIYVAGLDERGVAAFDQPETCLVLGRGVVGGDPGSRFRVGRALALVRQKAAVLDRLSLNDLEQTWAAAAYLGSEFQDPRYDPAVLKAMAKRLAKALSRREVKSLQSYADTFRRETMDVSSWRQAVMRAADRFGLLAGGDLAVALRVVIGTPEIGMEALRTPAALDLIHFALGDRYASARSEAGISRD